MRKISDNRQVRELVEAGAVVAYGIGGGKDSFTLVAETDKWLDDIGHPRQLRVCVHADLGIVEWPQSMEWVEKQAAFGDHDLLVVRRTKGDMVERWEQRWADNIARYIDLACVTVISPWSSSQWRFCTSELKVDPIVARLKKVFVGQTILNLTGIRREESIGRAKASVCSIMPKLHVKTKGTIGYAWNPILDYTFEDVLEVHKENSFPLHPAYTEYGSERLSCNFCVLARKADHIAALSCVENEQAYNRLTALELKSTFSFKSKEWLLDLNPSFVSLWEVIASDEAKRRSARRLELDALVPGSMRLTKGVPSAIPSMADAGILAGIRREMSDLLAVEVKYTTAKDIRDRYAEMLT